MSTPQEREEATVAGNEIFKLASGKNKDAARYLHMYSRVWRVLDDVYDGDHPITVGDIVEIIEYLFVEIPSNRFFIHHRDKLISQHITAYNAWMASNRWSEGNLEQRISSHVWRGDYQAVIGLVALLTQGIDHMKVVDQKVRNTFGIMGEGFNINNLGE